MSYLFLENIDHRDYKRVKTSLPYVSKFVQQKMGDMEEAYEMLVRHYIIHTCTVMLHVNNSMYIADNNNYKFIIINEIIKC